METIDDDDDDSRAAPEDSNKNDDDDLLRSDDDDDDDDGMGNRRATNAAGDNNNNNNNDDDDDDVTGRSRAPSRPMANYGNIQKSDMDDEEDFDPNSPRSWPKKKKQMILMSLSAASFLVSVAQSIYLPSLTDIGQDLADGPENPKVEEQVAATLTLPLFLMGVMNLFVGPLSDVYGRKVLHMVGLLIFCGASVGCALSVDIFWLLGFRLLQAVGSASPMIVGAGAVSDIYPIKDRGRALALFLLGPLVGPVLGPLFGGLIVSVFSSEECSWKYLFWLLVAISGLLFIVSFWTVKETLYTLNKSTSRRIPNPLRPLLYMRYYEIGSLILVLSTGFAAFFSTNIHFPNILEHYFDDGPYRPAYIGLCYLPFGAGLLLGAGIGGRAADKLRKRGGTPEHRLLPSLLFMPLNGVVIILQGWAFNQRWHLSILLIISFFFGLTFVTARPGTNTYLIEKLKQILLQDVASSATGVMFFFMLPISAVMSQASVNVIEEYSETNSYMYGWVFTGFGVLVGSATIFIVPYIRREIRNAQLDPAVRRPLLTSSPQHVNPE